MPTVRTFSASARRRPRRWAGTAALGVALLTLAGAMSGPAVASDQWSGEIDGIIAADDMERSTSEGWGQALRGGPYAVSTPTEFNVREGTARAAVTPGHTQSGTLRSTEARDAEVVVDLAADQLPQEGNGLTAGLTLRSTSGSGYWARVHFGAGGQVTTSVVRTADGATEATIGDEAATTATVERFGWVRLRVQIEGTDEVAVRTKAWDKNGPEPEEWDLSVTDDSPQRTADAGSLGLAAYVSRGSELNVLRVDNFVAAELSAEGQQPSAPEPEPAPEPAPEPPETAPAGGERGAVAVGAAQYAVPQDAIFVAPGGSFAAAAGTRSRPYRSVQTAVENARPGQTIVLRGGTYHQSVEVPHDKPVTVQAYPGEAVWFDGTQLVTSWQRQGSTWVSSGWTAKFPSGASFTPGRHEAWFLDDAHPMAAHPDQVFLDGQPLRQVRSARDVVTGTFAVDYRTDTLTIGSDPAGRSVRASSLQQAWRVSAPDTTLQGFGVRGYGTPISTLGAVLLSGPRAVARDMIVVDNATIGISVGQADTLLERVTTSRNGILGIHANQADRLAVRSSAVTANNTEHFAVKPVSGGIKVTRTRGLTIADNQVRDNIGSTGIWTDESVYDMTMVNNTVTNNGAHGIEVELSDKGIIANNDVGANDNTGIFVFSSGNLRIFNNYVGENGYIGVRMMQDERRQANPNFAGHDPRRPIPDPTMPWVINNVTVANNVFGQSGILQFYVKDHESGVPADRMNVAVDGNLFVAKSGSSASLVGWGTADPSELITYNDLAGFARAKNPGWRNQAVPHDLSRQDRLDRAATAHIAVPLPGDVARAIGVPDGTAHTGLLPGPRG